MLTSPHETACLSRAQVRRIDELAVSQLHMPSIVLMENAGRNVAEWIHLRWPDETRTAAIYCGTGNNGGDGFVIARQLHNRGWRVRVYLVGDIGRLSQDAAVNHRIAVAMGLPVTPLASIADIERSAGELGGDEVIVDALLGTGFAGEVREPLAATIRALNTAKVRARVAVDVPSGLDCDSGAVGNVAFRATASVTFVAPKPGFAKPEARAYLGEIVVVDIGTPPELTARVRAEFTE
jgi:NAD(P)H-hydrate epimerase